MLVRVAHRTEYRYSQPLLGSVQYLRLTARSGAMQTVTRWKVACEGAELTEWTDHYGNVVHTVVLAKPSDRLAIEVQGEVTTVDTNGVVPTGMTGVPTPVYLRETAYTRSDPRLQRFAGAFRAAVRAERIAGLHALMLGIRDAVAYEKGGTHVHTTASESLALGRGVCQDHAHVFVAACRHLGVPARYVSGYLAAPAAGPNDRPAADAPRRETASHAWAEALVDGLGWVSFDCANGVSATEAYVRLAVGLDYADAAPVRGVRTGGGQEELAVSVEIDGHQQ